MLAIELHLYHRRNYLTLLKSMNKPFIENFNEKFMQVNIFVTGSIIDV